MKFNVSYLVNTQDWERTELLKQTTVELDETNLESLQLWESLESQVKERCERGNDERFWTKFVRVTGVSRKDLGTTLNPLRDC